MTRRRVWAVARLTAAALALGLMAAASGAAAAIGGVGPTVVWAVPVVILLILAIGDAVDALDEPG